MTLDEYFFLCFDLDLNLQPRAFGEYVLQRSIYKKGSEMAIVPTTVQASIMGYEYRTIKLDRDFILYELYKKNQCIMSNTGVELFPLYIPYQRAHGNVLLGGLGVGFLAQLLCQKKEIERVTVVEFSSDVINLCKFSHSKVDIVFGDFYAYINEQNLSRFDYIYFDTFSDGINHYNSVVIPMRKYLLDKYPYIPFDFWNEDMMKMEYVQAVQ